ncbi:pentatricopeptide repeat-containing protein DOT4, chloroplastic-like [Selaginella moellendorffii]|uniref:pentatricopeptide repeat-containing protein DOT4, chloroplastic-like n=1 Tax=Selaginella moellendorffii TaxID=88036 RepID=UPI000D1CD567|nr:pentatricopeptide repeat-containing protein DOT4, chloroplastic-like [Selaginella moellendorffii]|eukprot:XP_024521090.1 pentatricopeptide repeat-containing protein DOT4, chloroplastic-like [Selaginella moellendorffii]
MDARGGFVAVRDPRGKNCETLVALLRECRVLSDGRRIHAKIRDHGLDRDVFLGNLLIQMYGKCGSTDEASRVFQEMARKNDFSWTLMIGAYTRNHRHGDAVDFFFRAMAGERVEPDAFAYSAVLGACAKMGALDRGKEIHARIIACGADTDLVVQNALVSMYAKCRSLDDAWVVFQKIRIKDVVSWNAIISG